MENKSRILSEEFKLLWERNSPMYLEWGKLETLYQAIEGMTESQAQKVSAFRTPGEISQDIKDGKYKTDGLVLETIFVLWNRLLLRSCLKIRDSLDLLFISINTVNAYGCALASRSIIEHVALVQFFVKQVPWQTSSYIEVSVATKFSKELVNLTQGSTFDWDKLLYGNLDLRKLLASKDWKRPNNQRIPSIKSLVEALDKELSPLQGKDAEGHLHFIYSALCDVIHPSWGGDFIYAPQIYRDIKSERVFDEHFKRISTLFCLPVINVVLHFAKLAEFMVNNEPQMLVKLKSK